MSFAIVEKKITKFPIYRLDHPCLIHFSIFIASTPHEFRYWSKFIHFLKDLNKFCEACDF